MSHPFTGQAAPPGYRQMGGGYDAAVSEANQRAGLPQPNLQMQPQSAPQFNGALPPQMAGGFNAPMDSISPLAQLQQMQQQVPVIQQQQQQQAAPQQQAGQQPGQMPLRFGDMPRNLQQFQANQWAQQNLQQLPGNGLPPQMQQQQQVPAGIDINTRLGGPNIPPALQGRTLGEAVAIFNGMQQSHMQMMAAQQQQQAPVQQQGPVAQPPAPQQNGAQMQNGWDWRDPAGSTQRVIAPMLDSLTQKIETALAPVTQQSSLNAIQAAMQQASAEIGPQFTQYGAQILQRLQGADPRSLSNPQVWRVAAESVIGAAALAASRQQQQPVQYAQNGAPGLYPAQVVQPGQQPLPNLNSFYTEQPYQGGPGAQGAVQLTPQQQWAAQAMGMSQADYAAWFAPTASRGGR